MFTKNTIKPVSDCPSSSPDCNDSSMDKEFSVENSIRELTDLQKHFKATGLDFEAYLLNVAINSLETRVCKDQLNSK